MDEKVAVRVARSARAKYVVFGAYTVAPDGLVRISVKVQHVNEPTTQKVIEEFGADRDIHAIVAAIGAKVQKALGATASIWEAPIR